VAHGRQELNTTVIYAQLSYLVMYQWCTSWCVCRSACSISSSEAGSPRVFHSRVFSAPKLHGYGNSEWPWNIFSATANLSMASDTERTRDLSAVVGVLVSLCVNKKSYWYWNYCRSSFSLTQSSIVSKRWNISSKFLSILGIDLSF